MSFCNFFLKWVFEIFFFLKWVFVSKGVCVIHMVHAVMITFVNLGKNIALII